MTWEVAPVDGHDLTQGTILVTIRRLDSPSGEGPQVNLRVR
jgi:hypothetical protein